MFRFSATLILWVLFTTTVQSQSWDYEKYPERNLKFTHLDADIRLSSDPVISGDIIYTASLLRDSVNTLQFHATGVNVILVEVNGVSNNYQFRENQLIIDLESNYEKGEVIQIRIQYDANPQFGLHKNTNGTVWTSFLPNSIQHWMPVFENPVVTLTTNIVFTHPSELTIVANGRRGGSEILNVNESETTFSSNRSIPVTGLSFVASDFSNSINTLSTGSNSTAAVRGFGSRSDSQIHFYSETEYPDLEVLLQYTVRNYRAVEEFLSFQYPFRDLHFVLLEDDFLEVKNYGAGINYLYLNRGDLRRQINRSISAQWAGAYLREHQWESPDAILFIQAFISDHIFESESESESEFINDDLIPYNKLSDSALLKWTEFLQSSDSDKLKEDFMAIKEPFFNAGNRTIDWEQLSLEIYRETGRSYFNGIEYNESEEVDPMYSEYSVNIEWDEVENSLNLFFEAVQNPIDELVTIELVERNLSGQKIHELSITGENDGVVVTVSPSIEYVTLNIVDRDDLILNVNKPFLFWIAQLRRDTDPVRRVEAAKGLSIVRDNPDIQLALNDILRTETNPQVYAEILRSMSVLTNGASGTEERFIQYSSNDQHRDIQFAAVEALAKYQENERVIGRLNTIITQTNFERVRHQAISSLASITTADRFSTLSRNMITREKILSDVPFILNKLADKGELSLAVELAEPFLSDVFPTSVRLKSLELIGNYDESVSNWMKRLPGLLSDNNPAIRLAASEKLYKLNSQQKEELIENALEIEFDERIRIRLEN